VRMNVWRSLVSFARLEINCHYFEILSQILIHFKISVCGFVLHVTSTYLTVKASFYAIYFSLNWL
jgi:hypothetical protein